MPTGSYQKKLTQRQLFESTTNSTQGHENHINGVEGLVEWRGPGQHHSPLGKALLKNVVYASVSLLV
jgi:hypothetical protein